MLGLAKGCYCLQLFMGSFVPSLGAFCQLKQTLGIIVCVSKLSTGEEGTQNSLWTFVARATDSWLNTATWMLQTFYKGWWRQTSWRNSMSVIWMAGSSIKSSYSLSFEIYVISIFNIIFPSFQDKFYPFYHVHHKKIFVHFNQFHFFIPVRDSH